MSTSVISNGTAGNGRARVTSSLSVREVAKSFGSTAALRGVSFEVARGSTHALLGANGAGKSTLIKILDGVYPADAGELTVRGRADGGAGKLGVIHQDLGLVDELSVADNLMLVTKGFRRGGVLIDHRRELDQARCTLDLIQLDIDPRMRLGDLTLGERSMIAIGRLLARNADVLILDEVTAALTRTESEWLFGRMRAFTDAGGALVVVSHRLNEIVEHCDTVTLLRDGMVAYDAPTPALGELHALFASANQTPPVPAPRTGMSERPVLLQASGAGAETVAPFDLDVRSGEVVGLVGSLSSSLYDVAYLLAKRLEPTSGVVHHRAQDGGGPTPVGFLPEDRHRAGNLTGLRVAQNLTLTSLDRHARWGWVRRRSEKAAVARAITDMHVDPPDPGLLIGALSGGNQQKVLLGRAMLADPDVYVLCEPTRGVDITTRHVIYEFIRRVAAAGAAVVVVTIDLDDVLAVCDRVALVSRQRLETPIPAQDVRVDELLARLS